MRCFVTVANELSFTAAAEHLNMAQPALSRALRQLEDHFGSRLFDRTTRRVRLTAFGRAFLPEAVAVLEQFARAERIGREMGRGMRGQIRIGYTEFVAHDTLAPLLQRFTCERPNVQLDLHNMGTEQQRVALSESEIDFAIMVGPFVVSDIATHRVRNDDLVVLMPDGHRLAAKDAITVADLREEPLVVGQESSWRIYRRLIFREFARSRITPRITQEAPTPSAIMSLVAAGMGLTIFPRTYSETFASHMVCRPYLGEETSLEIICAWNKSRPNPLLTALVQALPPTAG